MSKQQQEFLRPAKGVKVRRPDGRHLAAEGETVTMSNYWQRRLDAGDVVKGGEPAAPAPAKGTGDGRDKGKRE